MYSATFIFAKKQYDDRFYRLDEEIAAMAKSIPGYLSEETWENPANGQVCNVYYWDSLEALQQLIKHPRHQEAKASQADWLDGYRVVISQVLRCYGDGRLEAPASGDGRLEAPAGGDDRLEPPASGDVKLESSAGA